MVNNELLEKKQGQCRLCVWTFGAVVHKILPYDVCFLYLTANDKQIKSQQWRQ